MNRHDLESETREQLHAEIRRSPAILKEYRRRHRWDWVSMVLYILAPFFFAMGIVVLPVAIAAPLCAPLLGRFADLGDIPLAHMIPSVGLMLGGQGMILAAICSLTLANGWTAFCLQKDLMAAAYWPVSDQDLNRRGRSTWAGGLLCLCWLLVPLTIGVALVARPSAWQLAALVIAVPLNAWHLMALAILWCSAIRTSATPNSCWMLPAGACFFLTWGIGASQFQPAESSDRWSEFLFMVPTGWVNGVIRHLFFEPHPLVIGYIAAIAATWIYAANWLRQGFRIREVQIGADGKITPTFESGLLTEAAELASSKSAQTQQITIPPSTQIPDNLRARTVSLLGHSWQQCGCIERFISRWMSKRERTLVGHLYQGQPRWTRAWLITTISTIGGGVLLAATFKFAHWLDGNGAPPETTAPMWLLLWILLLLVVEILVHVPSVRMQQEISVYRSLHPVFPIGWHDLLGTMRKIIWLRLLWLLPQALVLASLDWLFAPHAVGYSYYWALSAVVMLGVALEASAWLPFCTSTSAPLSLRRMLLLLALSLIAMCWGCGATAAFFPHVPVAVPAWAFVLLCTASIRKLAGWVYRTVLDFPCRETALPRGK